MKYFLRGALVGVVAVAWFLFYLWMDGDLARAQYGCQNQAIGMAGQCTAGGAVAGPFSGIGDVNSGAQFFYGTRAYNAAYATANGKLMNVTRASDSGTCDILASASTGGFGVTGNCSNGTNNGVTASTFCNATTCTTNTLYDSSGANNCTSAPCPATQATVADQFTLTFNCAGTSLPCLTMNGSTDILNAASGGTAAQPMTIAAVAERTGNFTTAGQLVVSGASQAGMGWAASANTVSLFAGSNATATASDSVLHSLIGVINNTTSSVVVDGTATTGTTSTNLWTTTTCLGAQCSTATFPATGVLFEVGMWPTGWNSTQYTNACHNQRLYYGTGGTC